MANKVEVDGIMFTYAVEQELVTVSHPEYGKKTTQVGGSPPESIARMMARELISKRSRNPAR
jgi:hypothetical protein